jgi:hypothetical protein
VISDILSTKAANPLEILSVLEEENQKILDKLRLREFLEKNKDLEEKLKQTDLKQKHDKTITEVTLG